MQQAIITRQSPAPDRDARDKKTESTRPPQTGNQAATERDHRSGSHLKAAETPFWKYAGILTGTGCWQNFFSEY